MLRNPESRQALKDTFPASDPPFWIPYILPSLQPIIRQKMLEASRWRMLERLEQQPAASILKVLERKLMSGSFTRRLPNAGLR